MFKYTFISYHTIIEQLYDKIKLQLVLSKMIDSDYFQRYRLFSNNKMAHNNKKRRTVLFLLYVYVFYQIAYSSSTQMPYHTLITSIFRFYDQWQSQDRL